MPSLQENKHKWNRCLVELLELGYDVEKELGSGSWGTVVKAFPVEAPGDFVAIKIIDRAYLSEESWKSVEREVDAMSCLDEHANIVKLIRVHETYSFIYLVMEFCSRGDVLALVQESEKGLKEDVAREIFKQLLEATHHAHKNSYVHRDIKLENIFLAEGNSVRLGDWGFARKMANGRKVAEFCGSVHYSAPEICLGRPYAGFGVDVWSLGVTLFALNSGLLPFWGSDEHAIVKKILASSYELVDSFSASLKDLVSKALEQDPVKRITVEEMLQHPWIQGQSLSKSSTTSLALLGGNKQPKSAYACAIPRLNLENVAPSTDEPLASAKKTSRFTDLPLLKTPKPTLAQRTPPSLYPPARFAVPAAEPEHQIHTARPSVMQLSARLAAEEKYSPTRKATKLHGFLDTIGALIKKKTPDNKGRKEKRMSWTKRELKAQLANKRSETTRD